MSKTQSLPIWRLKSQADRRFRAGHPWVYSNELQGSPKGIEPGALVELHDAGGKFLARGYGNPASLIAFRALSRIQEENRPDSVESLLKTLLQASEAREILGMLEASHRLCFGEADGIPGMVIDRYRLADKAGQVFVVQLHSAGSARLEPLLPELLQRFVESTPGIPWEKTALVLRNDLSVRKLEGLEEEKPRVLKEITGLKLNQTRIVVQSALNGPGNSETLAFKADLQGGQKTGFFLDQAANIQLAASRLANLKSVRPGQPLRVLDLFSYVGQWSAKLAHALAKSGIKLEVTAIDASQSALERAKANIEAQGATCKTIKADIFGALEALPSESFDLVICDPPALIQGRKDAPAGAHAYLQLNTQAFRLVRKGGVVVSCSCSALLDEESFHRALSKAAYRNRAQVRWVARGSQAPDHPMRIEFPEGRYLKCMIGLVQTGEKESHAAERGE